MLTNTLASQILLSISRMLHPASSQAEGASTPRGVNHTSLPVHATPRRWPAGFAAIPVALLLLVGWVIPLQAQASEPSAPTIVSASESLNPLGDLIRLDWSAPTDNGGSPINRYRIRRSSEPDQRNSWSNAGRADGSVLYGTVSIDLDYNPDDNPTEYFHVIAVNSDREQSAASNVVSVSPNSDGTYNIEFPTRPKKPTGLDAVEGDISGEADREVRLTWLAPVNDGDSEITDYIVQRRIGEGGDWVEIEDEDTEATEDVVNTHLSDHITSDESDMWGQDVSYRVRAVNALGKGKWSSEENVRISTVPNPPTNLVLVRNQPRQIELRWSDPENHEGSRITSYNIEHHSGICDSGSGVFVPLKNGLTGALTYLHESLDHGAMYCYRVTANNAAGPSLPSDAEDATTWMLPNPPTDLNAKGVGPKVILFSWTPPTVGEGDALITGYSIRYYFVESESDESSGDSEESAIEWEDDIDVAADAEYYEHTELPAAQIVHYQIRTKNQVDSGPYSGIVIGTTLSAVAPGRPTGLGATNGESRRIDLIWAAPADDGGADIEGYRIERSTDGNDPWTDLVPDTGNANTRYPHTGLDGSLTVHYRVSAINSAGHGLPSNEASGTTAPPTAPTAPLNFTATSEGRRVELDWNMPSDTGGATITGYRITRSGTGVDDGLQVMVGAGSTEYTDNVPGRSQRTLSYSVSAVNAAGATATPWRIVKIATLPSAPLGLSAEGRYGEIRLTWGAPQYHGGAEITGYHIEKSADGRTGWTEIVADTGSADRIYVHKNLLGTNQTVHYRVKSINPVGRSGAASNVASATTGETEPGAPSGVTATSGASQQVELSWSAPAYTGGRPVSGYRIEVSEYFRLLESPDPDHWGPTSWRTLVSNTGNRTSYTQSTGLTAGSRYGYRVYAINSLGEGPSADSDPDWVRVPTIPGRPTGLTLVAGTDRITLTWTEPDDGGSPITSYRIERARKFDRGLAPWGTRVSRHRGGPSYTDYIPYIDTSWGYRVYAVNAVGENPEASNVAIATLLSDSSSQSRSSRSRARSISRAPAPKKPGAPIALRATGSAGQVELNWGTPASNGGAAITGYRVQRSDTGLEGSWTNRASDTQSTRTSYTDSGLASGRIFHYRVAAINSAGRGAWSNSERAVTTLSPEELLSSRGTLRGFGGSHAGNTLAGLAGRLGRSALDSQSRHARIGGQDLSAFASLGKDDEEGRTDARQAMESVMGLIGLRLPESGELAQGLAAPGASSPAAGFEMGALPTSGVARASSTGRGDEDASSGEGLDFRRRSKREWIAGSSFEIPLAGSGFVDEAGQAKGGWTVWGKAAHSEFDGGDSQSSNQETLSGYMGMDFQGGGNWLMGVAVGSSANDPVASDEWKFNLASVTQYAQWSPTPKLHIHGLVSVGRGDASRAITGGGELGTELETRMAAFGMESVLYQQGRSELSVKGDALMVTSMLKATEAFPEIRADEHRVRVMFEGKHGLNEGGKVPAQLSLNIAARMDGSDIEESSHQEIGAGFEVSHAPLGLHFEANGRFLVAHSEQDYQESGASLAARFDPGVRGDGISLSLESNWGVSASSRRDIWSDSRMRVRSGSSSNALHSSLDVKLAYGADWLSEHLRLEPFGEFGFDDAALSGVRFGARINVGDMGVLEGRSPLLDNMQIEFFSERENMRSEDSEHRHGIEVKVAF